MGERDWIKFLLASALLSCWNSIVWGVTDTNDFAILDDFRKGLDNPELLNWPSTGNDPCGSSWSFVYCHGSRVTQIQAKNLGLIGSLPQSFNQLTELVNLGLQNNNLTGKLPSFSGLSKLRYAFLGNNQFGTIPSDFFVGLTSLQVLSLNYNLLNQSGGWALPLDIQNSAQLTNLSLMGCNLVGPLPDFLGGMQSLSVLRLSYNNLSGEIPASYSGLPLEILWLNNQKGSGLTGSINPIASMTQLTSAWLHGNAFTGPIPSSAWACTSLTVLWLNDNQLVGLIPDNLTSLPQLQSLVLQNNKLMGPIPKVSFSNFTYLPNIFCQSEPGLPCSPEVTALLDFLDSTNYPLNLVNSWSGNDPCAPSSWLGVFCSSNNVSLINLSNFNLNGTISPSLGKLGSLTVIRLGGNHLSGKIPDDLAGLTSLKLLNLSANNLGPPVPKFSSSVKLLVDGNPKLDPNASPPPSGDNSPSGNSPSPPGSLSPNDASNVSKGSKKSNFWIIIVPIVAGVLVISSVVLFVYCRQRGKRVAAPSSIIIHPRNSSDPDNMVKIVVANNTSNSIASSDHQSSSATGTSDTQLIEAGNLVVSVQVLRNVTRNFSPENELGRGGFGVVYKGELHDGTMIAVKRMQSGMISNKAFDEFQAEIAVLSKVRHRNLVSLLGFCTEGNERVLVYEYMPQGALSMHLFHWQDLNLEPLSWKRRLNIALDVARGMEYLHSLAHQSFIHRDLKSSNILLDDDYRAKVADFGLVKLAHDGKYSVATRLAGTFGYLAPEYAVTGKITTKVDVFSFGVVLMELVTGMMALDEDRPEETRHLASWFYHIKSNREKLKEAVDKSLDTSEETFQSVCTVAELAGHCTGRDPHQRPEMGHAVNVLGPLVEKWKPMNDDLDESLGIDLGQPLLQMVKGWQAADGNSSSLSLDDSKGSIPARPAGFAESFTSADGR